MTDREQVLATIAAAHAAVDSRLPDVPGAAAQTLVTQINVTLEILAGQPLRKDQFDRIRANITATARREKLLERVNYLDRDELVETAMRFIEATHRGRYEAQKAANEAAGRSSYVNRATPSRALRRGMHK